jgi:DNA repair exonuclease SbcCD ATPase subunit
MRTSTVLFAIFFSAMVFAAPANTNDKIIELMQMNAKAADAVDSALQVLYDLETANHDAQDAADELNRTQQAACDAEIEDLRQIAESNKDTAQSATAHRQYLESEIASTEEYLAWIESRRAEIHAREEELQDQRCYSNAIFIRALKEQADGLTAIDLLRNDVLGAAERSEGSTEELLQVKDATKKLSAYKNLFNEQAIAEFEQLANQLSDDVDYREEGLKLMAAGDRAAGRGVDGGNVMEQIHNLLNKFETHLEENIATLQANEVSAAWALAVWLQDSEDELEYLQSEEDKKEAYLEKLNISLQAAKANEAKAWEIFHQSAQAYNNAIEECIRKGEAYLAATHQRQDENALILEVIKMFKEQVANTARGYDAPRKQNTSDKGSIASNTQAAADAHFA